MSPCFFHSLPDFSFFKRYISRCYYWYTIYIPLLNLEISKRNKKGHTYGICMRRCVLLQSDFLAFYLFTFKLIYQSYYFQNSLSFKQ
ncbi:hypothetical protein COE26_27870 [Bacillus cereus]|nr:hypothetical protein COE26_27870 [Bacillus cereus]